MEYESKPSPRWFSYEENDREDALYDDYKDRKMDLEMELRREEEARERDRQAAVERQKSDPLWGSF